MPLSNPTLQELADAVGIATEFWDWKGRLTQVSDHSVVSILASLDIDASTPEAAEESLAVLRDKPWRRAVPACTVMRQGDGVHVNVHVTAGADAVLTVRLEDGGERETYQTDNWAPPRMLGGREIGEATFWIPGDLPLGYHRLALASEGWVIEGSLIVTPQRIEMPDAVASGRAWGYAAQLYSVRSAESWCMGDLADLGRLSSWAGRQQADYVLVNPLHAAEPVVPIEPSPYLPSSRRYMNPLYLRPEALPEYASLDAAGRAEVAAIKDQLCAQIGSLDSIARDPIWDAKLTALRLIFDRGLTPALSDELDAFIAAQGHALTQFAAWCALVPRYGRDWRVWPEPYRRPTSPEVAAFTDAHADDIRFHSWLQYRLLTQLEDAQAAAAASGMGIGVMCDLAVGVSQCSAEAWIMGDAFARGVNVGAPADHYNQLGQDWGQAPWRPDRLEELAYEPFRAMVAAALAHAGGLRIDHVMGLFRLWWVPNGFPASEGAYVHYNADAMVGIVALEAARAGSLVIGEDLGTVAPGVREYLAERGILGTSVAWFEAKDDGWPLEPEGYRAGCMASVTTHDMPPTAGYLEMNHLALQNFLGLLTEDVQVEIDAFQDEIGRWRTVLEGRGMLHPGEGADEAEDFVLAMHRYICATPATVLNVALVDAVGDRRTQNQPGTQNEYPNWRVPLADAQGHPITLDDVESSDRALRLAHVMNGVYPV